MNTYWIIRILLALHITGVVIMAGTTTIDYLTFKTFWNFVDHGDTRSSALLPLMAKYGKFVRAGAIMIILTGIAMFILQKGVLWEQLRFKIKIGLVILLSLNGMLVGNRYGHKLREAVEINATDFIQRTSDLKEILNRFYLMQLTLFAIIIFISVLKQAK